MSAGESWNDVSPQRAAALVVAHVLLPAAIIGMSVSFLWFLIDVRSAFRPGNEAALRWIGTCLVVASVMIVRYGRTEAEPGKRLMYLAWLGMAALPSMALVSKKIDASIPVNVAMACLAWWFASAITNQLSFEGEPEKDRAVVRFFGDSYRDWQADNDARRAAAKAADEARRRIATARTAAAAPRAHRAPAGPAPRSSPAKRRGIPGWIWGSVMDPPDVDAFRNSTKGAVVLAMGALVVFAVAEPVLLVAHPSVGPRAFQWMVAYLACTAIVLSAGSVMGATRHALERDGSIQFGLVTLRTAVGCALALVVLVAALALPGLDVVGTGELRGRTGNPRPGSRVGEDRPTEDTRPGDATAAGEHEDAVPARDDESHAFVDDAVSAPLTLVQHFLSLPGAGILLRLLGVAVLACGAVLLLRHAWPAFLRWRAAGLSSWLADLLARLRLRQRSTARTLGPHPFRDLGALAAMPPSQAVQEAYGRMLDAAERLGVRDPQLTPFEFLRALPHALEPAREAVTQLTHLHAAAAYSPKASTPEDRLAAIGALRIFGDRVPLPQG